MRIGTTTKKFIKKSHSAKTGLEHTDFEKMSKLGYTAADLSAIADGRSYIIAKASEDEFEAYLKEERLLAEENGIWINQVHGPWPCHDDIEENRPKNIEHMKKCVRGAALLGAEVLVCHVIMPEGWGKETDSEFAWNMNLDVFSRIADYASEYNIKIAIENLPFKEISLATVEKVRKLVDTINRPNLGICLDTGHANVLGLDAGEAVRICKEKLFCLHVHDNKGSLDDTHQIPFLCNINWQNFTDSLKEINFAGVFSLESNAYALMRGEMPEHLAELFFKFEAETAKYLASCVD